MSHCVESQPESELLFEAVCVRMLLDQVDFLVHSLAALLGGHSLLTGFKLASCLAPCTFYIS